MEQVMHIDGFVRFQRGELLNDQIGMAEKLHNIKHGWSERAHDRHVDMISMSIHAVIRNILLVQNTSA